MPPDRDDLLFRAAAFVVAAVSLWLVVVVVTRNPVAGAVALAVGISGGVAMVVAAPDRLRSAAVGPAAPPPDGDGWSGHGVHAGLSGVPEPGTTQPGPPDPLSAGSGPARRRRPAPTGTAAGGTQPDRSPARSAVAVATPAAAGHVLGTGSSAGRAPWRLPVRAGQPGIAADAMTLGDLEVRAASVIGPAHRCQEPAVARQDAYLLGRDDRGEHLVIAVADGLGASAQSELGARVAVSTAVRELTAALDRLRDPTAIDVGLLFRTVAGEITGTGRGRGVGERDLCCLLVVAVVPARPGPDGSRRVWTAQLGDVSVWTHGSGWRQEVGQAKSGFDRNVVDAVLPFHPREAVSTLVTVPPGHGVAVLTDGVGDLLNDVVDAREFFAAQWAVPPPPAAFLADLCVDAPGQDDDRTAVVVWCGVDARRR